MTRFFSVPRDNWQLFDAFFDSGMEESVSPFITPSSRRWGKNVEFRASLFAAALLMIGAILSFFPAYLPLSHLALLMTYFFAGIPSLISAVEDLSKLEINIDVLMVLAAFLSIFIGSGYEGGLLLVLFSFSSSLEKLVSGKAKQAVHSLKGLSPSRAYTLQSDGTLLERSVRDIAPGTSIFVKAGQLIPLDGRVISGSSSINLVHLTGENRPVSCHVGDAVPAGASNLDGSLTIMVTHTSSESTLSRIIKLIHHASESRPKLQRWFDQLTNRYAIAIILFSTLFATLLPLVSSIPLLGHEGSIYRALAFLIAASPCALILAIPIAYLSAMSSCARKGIILKGGVVLDALTRCQKIAFDKTGTLTEGQLDCIALDTQDRTLALQIAYALEQQIEHPIAKAICRFAAAEGILPVPLESFRSLPGYGVEATYRGQSVSIGNGDWILPKLNQEERARLIPLVQRAEEEGETLAILLVNDSASLFRLSDRLREGAAETIQILKNEHNLPSLMMTGDHKNSAKHIGKEVGISEIYADLKPEDKLAIIEKLSQTEGLAMVGDGMNDAPALARATVGIAMGGIGTHTASEAADVILLHDRIDHLNWLFAKAKLSTRIVNQNIFLAAGAILVAVIPALFGFLPLWLAVLLHEGGTVIVGMNALRLLRR